MRVIGLVAIFGGIALARFGPIEEQVWAQALMIVLYALGAVLLITSFVLSRKAKKAS